MIKTKRRLFLTTILAIISAFLVLFGFITYKKEKVTASAESSTAYFTPGASIGKTVGNADKIRFRLNLNDFANTASIKINVSPFESCSFYNVDSCFLSTSSDGEAWINLDSHLGTTESGNASYNIMLSVNPQIEYTVRATVTMNNGTTQECTSDTRSIVTVLNKMKEAGASDYAEAATLHKEYMDSVINSSVSNDQFNIVNNSMLLDSDGTVKMTVSLTNDIRGRLELGTVTNDEKTEITNSNYSQVDSFAKQHNFYERYDRYELLGIKTNLPYWRRYLRETQFVHYELWVIADQNSSYYGATGSFDGNWTKLHQSNASERAKQGVYFRQLEIDRLDVSSYNTVVLQIDPSLLGNGNLNYYVALMKVSWNWSAIQEYNVKWFKENTLNREDVIAEEPDVQAVAFSKQFISKSRKTWASEILSTGSLSDYSDEQLKGYQTLAGTYTGKTEIPVTVKYKSLQSGGEYIADKTSVFNVNSLYAQNMNSVLNAMYALGTFSQLSDFNVVRKNAYFDQDDKERRTGDRIIRQATGYKYEYDSTNQKGTLTIEYSDFHYKDVMITLQSNDAESHLTKDFYTANATQANGKITLVFNYDDLEMWGKNNCGWLFRLQKDNFTITNNSGGKVSVVNDGNARTLTLTCAEENENSLGEVSLRAVSEIVENVTYTMTYKYKIIEDEAGELTESTITSSPVEIMYSELVAMSYGNFMTDYGNTATENLLPATLAGTNYCKAIDYRKAYDTENLTCEITLIYEYRSVFKVTDNQDENFYKFLPASETSLSYAGEYFCINDYEGYRVSKIESGDTSFARVTPNAERPDDWKNAKIDILCRISDGNVIPIKVIYTDKYKVRVEYLQNFVSTAKDGKQEASGVAEKKITEKEVTIDTFAKIYSPTENELKKFLNFTDLRVIGKFGAPDLEKTVVTFSDDTYTIKLSYAYAAVKVQQSDGSYEEVKVPMSSYAEWTKSFGKDWSVLFLNTEEKVIFTDTVTVKPENVYGYFFVSVFKEQVKNLDMLFAGYASDGCKTFYQYEEVKGSAFYKFMADNPALLPIVGGAVGAVTGLILGHPIKGTTAGVAGGAGVYYSIMSVAEMANDENGTYYSYFSFLDGTSELPYTSNSKADGFSDNDSAAKNTVENVVDDVKNFLKKLWNNDNEFTKFIKIILGLFAFYLIFSIVLKIVAAVIRFFRKTKK